MDENGTIEKRIIDRLYHESRGTHRTLLHYLRRQTGGRNLELQQVGKRCAYLESQEILEKVGSFRGDPIWILTQNYRDALDQQKKKTQGGVIDGSRV